MNKRIEYMSVHGDMVVYSSRVPSGEEIRKFSDEDLVELYAAAEAFTEGQEAKDCGAEFLVQDDLNIEGMSWEEWANAAGVDDFRPSREVCVSWRLGEDPSEWRAEQDIENYSRDDDPDDDHAPYEEEGFEDNPADDYAYDPHEHYTPLEDQ